MKALISFFLCICFASLQAQDNKTISILVNPADTTYKFVEVTTTEDGDTSQIRYFPPSWLSADQFGEYLLGQALSAEDRMNNYKIAKAAAKKEFEFYKATLDTIFGAGTFHATVNVRHLNVIQGNWTLIERQGNNKQKFAVTIAQDNFKSGTKEAKIAIVDRKSFKLTGWLPVAVLKFTLRKNGNYVAKRGQKRYILKRQ